jgi:hypothetical protein
VPSAAAGCLPARDKDAKTYRPTIYINGLVVPARDGTWPAFTSPYGMMDVSPVAAVGEATAFCSPAIGVAVNVYERQPATTRLHAP